MHVSRDVLGYGGGWLNLCKNLLWKHSIVFTNIDTCIYSVTHAHTLVCSTYLAHNMTQDSLQCYDYFIFFFFTALPTNNYCSKIDLLRTLLTTGTLCRVPDAKKYAKKGSTLPIWLPICTLLVWQGSIIPTASSLIFHVCKYVHT